jgi:hypothetical protein
MTAKSFVENRVNRLAALSSIEAFEDLVFGGDARLTGNTGNSNIGNIEDVERHLGEREREAIAKIMRPFLDPPKFLLMLAESDSLAKSSAGDGDIGTTGEKNSATPETPGLDEIARQNSVYYTALWRELEKVPYSDRRLITGIIAEEIRLKNVVWALRLRVYYLLSPQQIGAFLIAIKPGNNQMPLHHDALKSLEPDVEEEAQWHDWRLWKYVNKPVSGQYWKIDPRFFQNQASLYLYHLARKALRKNLFTLDTVCCFIRLKQFEKEVLTSVAEAVRLGLTGADALGILGLSGKAV